MRILFASTHTYLPQRAGGLESSTHDLCRQLGALGDEVAVLARLRPLGLLGLWNRIRRKLPGGRAFPSDFRMGYRVYRGWDPLAGAAEVLRDFGPDVVIAQGSAPVPLARELLRLDVPAVLYLRDVEFDRLGGAIPVDPRLLLLANSRYTSARAEQRLGVRAAVVPPLIRPEAYRTPGSGGRVLFVNPHPWKGVEIAFGLAERRPDIPFLFLEAWKLTPEQREEYRRRAAAAGNVEWRESVRDMRAIYAEARVVLVPSQWEEAWGRVASEAQVSGIPVLASDRGGLPESVGPGGLLVDAEAPIEEWEAALSRLWDDASEHRRLSEAALSHARRPEFQPGTLVSRLRGLLAAHVEARSAHEDAGE